MTLLALKKFPDLRPRVLRQDYLRVKHFSVSLQNPITLDNLERYRESLRNVRHSGFLIVVLVSALLLLAGFVWPPVWTLVIGCLLVDGVNEKKYGLNRYSASSLAVAEPFDKEYLDGIKLAMPHDPVIKAFLEDAVERQGRELLVAERELLVERVDLVTDALRRKAQSEALQSMLAEQSHKGHAGRDGRGSFKLTDRRTMMSILDSKDEDLVTLKSLITEQMELNGEDWDDVVGSTASPEEMSETFDKWCKYKDFTFWTTNRVYFPVNYQGAFAVVSVSRNPDGVATAMMGGE